MKRKWKHRLRKAAVFLLVSSWVGAWAAGQLFIQPCLQLDKTACRSGGVMFDIGRFDDTAAIKRQVTRSSASDPIAKLVSTLP